ncbi:hypothetical protein AVEN_178564-1 [Araneus ventricosus]|uniref:Uncharacterized protein n=1 Tax=Araneus ventricosus TaxID=182803 RepID=A0A4Y2FLS8_ARAVE|nr:hypothetical protein AVEN_178564-1 [Araneus ventricosus]
MRVRMESSSAQKRMCICGFKCICGIEWKAPVLKSLNAHVGLNAHDFPVCCRNSFLVSIASLVVRCRPRIQTAAGSKTYSTEDPSCIGPVAS